MERAIGVIEAGCLKERRQIVYQNINHVEIFGRTYGPAIAASLPQVLLQLIATRAMELIGADAASLHVFRGSDEFVIAGAGRATKDFLKRYSTSGSSREATQKRIVENQHSAL